MKLLWCSDLHLNFLDDDEIAKFIGELASYQADALVITGDIGTAKFIHKYLEAFLPLDIPIYFVLGNHDFYGSSVSYVRKYVSDVANDHPNLIYLTDRDRPIQLTDDTLLVGVDGWADGRLGDWEGSKIMEEIRDYTDIIDFLGLNKNRQLEKMQELAREYTEILCKQFRHIQGYPKQVLVATHAPPFQEACIHMGHVSDPHWLPIFSSYSIGENILWHSKDFPKTNFLVLCGHTHSEGQCDVADNVRVYTAGAEYYKPCVCRVLTIGEDI